MTKRAKNVIVKNASGFTGVRNHCAVLSFSDFDKVGIALYQNHPVMCYRGKIKGHLYFNPNAARRIAKNILAAADMAEKAKKK